MRITAGRLGGRLFDAPRGHRTHPMGDRPKAALFNTLGDIEGLTVLDAFAGSGALGFEAASRGAVRVVSVEADKTAQKAIEANIKTLNLDEVVHLVRAYVYSWMRRTHELFDIVIADPPYDDLQYKTLDKLPDKVKVGGVLVYSLPPTARLMLPPTCVKLAEKSYGDATLAFYRKVE